MHGFKTRLRKLESKLAPRPDNRYSIGWLTEGLPPERTNNLADGERVVTDWYRERGGYGDLRERITNDPTDQGRSCKWGGYLIDVIEEIHQTCPERERRGSCYTCEGTPVAECRPPGDTGDSK